MIKKMIISMFSGVALLSVTTAAGAANLIKNGSFEYGTDPNDPNNGSVLGFIDLTAGSTAITDWTVGGTGIDYIGGYWQAADGYRSLDLSGDYDVGSVSQAVQTVLGQKYSVTFALAGNPYGNYLQSYTKSVLVTVGSLYSGAFDFSTANTSLQNMGWTDKSFTFVGDGKYDTITFASLNHSGYGPALDNVRMTVPLAPPSALVDLSVLAVLYAFARRQSRGKT